MIHVYGKDHTKKIDINVIHINSGWVKFTTIELGSLISGGFRGVSVVSIETPFVLH